MLMIDIPTDKQAVIEQASQVANLSLNDFAVNQLYYASLAMINQQNMIKTSDNTLSDVFGIFVNQGKILGDIIEPIGEEDWDYGKRETQIVMGN